MIKVIYILILISLFKCTGGLYDLNPENINEISICKCAPKEITIELLCYEYGDENVELSLYRDNNLVSTNKQFNTAMYSEAQKLTYKFITDSKHGVYLVKVRRPFYGKIISIKKQ